MLPHFDFNADIFFFNYLQYTLDINQNQSRNLIQGQIISEIGKNDYFSLVNDKAAFWQFSENLEIALTLTIFHQMS